MTIKTKKSQTTLQIRLDSQLKNTAQQAFEDMGTNLTDGLKMYLKYISLHKEMPFQPTTQISLDRLNKLPKMDIDQELEAEIDSRLEKIKSGKTVSVKVGKSKVSELLKKL